MAIEKKRASRRSASNYRGYQPAKKSSAASKCKNCCRKFTAFMFSHVGLCGLVVGYSIMGAFVFQALEAPHESEKVTEVIEMRRETVSKLWDITYQLNILYKDNWTSLVHDEIIEFQSRLIGFVKDGYDGNDQVGHGQQWSFSGAFLYSLTVITTIGYGNIAPRTSWGKIVTIIYAIFGIPLMLLYLTNIGDILAKSFKYIYSRVCQCGGSGPASDAHKRRRPPAIGVLPYNNHETYRAHHYIASNQNSPNANKLTNEMGMPITIGILPKDKLSRIPNGDEEVRIEAIPDSLADDDEYDKPRVTVPITLCLLILVSYIFGGAMVFSVWEGWDYLDGSYFCFVTLSTIGFGDLVPGASTISDSGSQEKLVLCSLYLLVGMALIAMCFNLMQEEVIHKVRNFGMRIGIVKNQEEEEED